MLPLILVAVGAYLIGDSVLGNKKLAKGGIMANGGEIDDDYRSELSDYILKKYDGKTVNGFKLNPPGSADEGSPFNWELKRKKISITAIPFWDWEEDLTIAVYKNEDEYLEQEDFEYPLTGNLEKDTEKYIELLKPYFEKYAGKMAKGGEVTEQEAKEKLVKLKEDGKLNFSIGNHGLIFMSLKNGNKKSYDNYKKAYEHYLESKDVKTQGYDDKEDERLAMEHGKMSKKDLDSTHARKDDARFEERGKMAKGGMIYLISDDGYEVNISDADFSKETKMFFKKSMTQQEVKKLGTSKYNSFIHHLSKKGYEKMAKGGELEWANEENEKLGKWLLSNQSGKKILEDSKNSKELEKNVRDYAKEHNGVAGLEMDDEDEGLEWVTFDDLYKELKSRSKMARGGKLVGKQKNLDVNKNGKLDAEDFKMLRKGKK